MEKKPLTITRFNTVRASSWIIRVSRSNHSGVVCVVMFHIYLHVVKVAFFRENDDVVNFINSQLKSEQQK